MKFNNSNVVTLSTYKSLLAKKSLKLRRLLKTDIKSYYIEFVFDS